MARDVRRAGGGWTFDVASAAVIIAFLLLATTHVPVGHGARHLDGLGYALIVAGGGSLVLCRRRPDVVVGVVTAVLGAYLVRGYAGGPIYVTGWVSLFFLSWRSSRRAGLLGASVMVAVLVVAALIAGEHPLLVDLVFVGWSAAALFLGDALRNRRGYLTELEARAQYLEHTREEEARRRVAEDRLRIARDLHDSVAHAMATINVQAGAAAHVVDRRPAAAQEALRAIQRASADVLDELAAMLRLLRDDAESATRSPTPGVAQIPVLVASMHDARLPVRLETGGPVDDVTPAIGTAAYRIVQESLTNVLRHAAAAPTIVTVRAEVGRFTVEVADDGPGLDAGLGDGGGAGMGIRGMRERTEATGGTFVAGPRAEGGFIVRAEWTVAS